MGQVEQKEDNITKYKKKLQERAVSNTPPDALLGDELIHTISVTAMNKWAEFNARCSKVENSYKREGFDGFDGLKMKGFVAVIKSAASESSVKGSAQEL